MPVVNFSLIISRSVRDPSTYYSLEVPIVKFVGQEDTNRN